MLNVTAHKVVTGLQSVEAILCPKNFNVCYFNAFRSVKLTFIFYLSVSLYFQTDLFSPFTTLLCVWVEWHAGLLLTDPLDEFLISELVLRSFNVKTKTFPWKYEQILLRFEILMFQKRIGNKKDRKSTLFLSLQCKLSYTGTLLVLQITFLYITFYKVAPFSVLMHSQLIMK